MLFLNLLFYVVFIAFRIKITVNIRHIYVYVLRTHLYKKSSHHQEPIREGMREEEVDELSKQ